MIDSNRLIFISYARRDYPFVQDLFETLRQAGYEPWVDLLSVSGGDRWTSAIQTALKECACCLVVVSRYSIKSREVEREYEFALQQGRNVIPILLQTAKLLPTLGELQWVDFRVDFEHGSRLLLDRLAGKGLSASSLPAKPPPRPQSHFGWVPLALVACPRMVKTVLMLLGMLDAFKAGVGAFSIIVATDALGAEEEFYFYLLGGCGLFTSLYGLWSCLRAANRRPTRAEFAGLTGFSAVIWPLFGVMGLMENPAAHWPLGFGLFFGLSDLILSAVIWKSRLFRRWLPAYSAGLWAKDAM